MTADVRPAPRRPESGATPWLETWGWEYREPDILDRQVHECSPVLGLPGVDLQLPGKYRPLSRLMLTAFLIMGATAGLVWLLAAGVDPARYPVDAASDHRAARVSTWIVVVMLALLLLVRGVRAWHCRVITGRYRQWLRHCLHEHEQYQARLREWQARQDARRHTEQERHAAQQCWYPIQPAGPLDRVDLCGGTTHGWAAWLSTVGTSLIATERQVTVLDLTREAVADVLADNVAAGGHPADRLVLPDQWHDRDIFAGHPAGQVAEVLAESVHATEAQASHRDRSMDLRILGEICGFLEPPHTLARIAAALRVVLRREPPPENNRGDLSTAEYGVIADAFGEIARRQVEQRSAVLEAVLHPLATLSRTATGGESTPVSRPVLRVLSVSDSASEAAVDLLNQLLLQLALLDMRTAGTRRIGDQVLIVAGADMLRRTHLENLTRLARLRGFRLAFMFHHLREENIELLGAGGVVYVMRLGNTTEATKAAEFIGRHHKFLLHQYTLTEGTGTSESDAFATTSSLARGASWGMGGGSRSITNTGGISRTRTSGSSTTDSNAMANQRVYEFSVEPTTLQTLPDMMFIFMDPSRTRGPRARVGDCQPDLGPHRTPATEPGDFRELGRETSTPP
jgi:hypothetical protein